MAGKLRVFVSVPLLLLLLLLLGAILFIKSEYAAERLCTGVSDALRGRLGLSNQIQSCAIDLLPPAVEARGVRLQGADGNRLLSAAAVRVELDTLALLASRLRVDRIRIERPQLHLSLQDGQPVNLPRLPAAGGTPGEGGEVEWLPERLDVTDGRVDITLDRRGLLQLRAVRLSTLAREDEPTDWNLEIGGGSLELAGGDGVSLPVGPGKVRLATDKRGAAISRCTLGLGGAKIQASGRVDWRGGEVKPRLQVTVSGPLELIHRFLPAVPPMEGQAVVSAEVEPSEAGPRARGALDAKGFGILTVHDIDVRSDFTADLDRLRLDSLLVTGRAARVTGKAELAFATPLAFSGHLKLEGADLGESLALAGLDFSAIELGAQGGVGFQGQMIGKNGAFVVLDADLALERLAVPAAQGQAPWIAMSGARLKAQAAFSARRVRFPAIRLERGETVVTGEGKIRFHDGQVDARLQAAPLSLPDLGLPLLASGSGQWSVGVSGRFPRPDLDTELALDGVNLAGVPVGSLRGRVRLADARLAFEHFTLFRQGAAVRLDGGLGLAAPHRLEGRVELEEVRLDELWAGLRSTPPPLSLAGRIGGQLEASGDLASPELVFRLAFADARFGPLRSEEGGAVGRLVGKRLELEGVEARLGPGWIFGRGSISEAGELDLLVYSTGLRAASFPPLEDRGEQLDFRLDLHATARGPLRSPAIEGWAKAYDTLLFGVPVEDSFVSTQVGAEGVQVAGRFLGQSAELSGQMALSEGLPLTAELKFARDKLGKFLPRLTEDARTEASIAGRLDLNGRLLQPEEMVARLVLSRLVLRTTGLALANSGEVRLVSRGRRLEVERCELTGTETSLQLSGGGDWITGPRLAFRGLVGLGLLPLWLPFLPRAAGRAEVRLSLGGSWAEPQLTGSAALDAPLLRLAWLPSDLLEVSGQVRFNPDRLEVTRVRGRMGGGTFSVQGELGLRAFSPEELALTIELDGVRYEVNKNLWAVGTGTLRLSGSPHNLPLSLAGEVRLPEGAFREQIELVTFDNGLFRRRRSAPRTFDASREVLVFDLRLSVPERFQASYSLGDLVRFQAEMKGEVQVTGTNERLGLIGELESLGGSVDYLSKGFEVRSARVQFTERYEIAPRFEIEATRTEAVDRGEEGETSYQIALRLQGEGDSIRVALLSDPPLDERDIVTLLSLGVTSRDVDALQGENLVGLGGEIFLRSFKIDERLNKLFPFPPEVIQPKYLRLRSRFSARTGTSPRLETGAKLRFLSDDLDLDYSRSLFDDTDQSLDLSYRLSRGVTARLRWEDAVESDVGDFGLDMRLSWEW